MTTKANTPTLTVDILEGFYDHPDWLGFGYLGVRQTNMATAAGRAKADMADTAILTFANLQGWTEGELFAWANSKVGRWYGEEFFYGGGSTPGASDAPAGPSTSPPCVNSKHVKSLMVKVME